MSKFSSTTPIMNPKTIEAHIHIIRGKKIMLDRDLAALYHVPTGDLNRAVLRHIERFPGDFMFQLTPGEFDNLIRQTGRSNWGGTRKLPRAFTDYGILMLSSVLKSRRAIQVNIGIMRTYTKMRELALEHTDLRIKIEELEKNYDRKFKVVFDALRELMTPPVNPNKRPIGFRMHEDQGEDKQTENTRPKS